MCKVSSQLKNGVESAVLSSLIVHIKAVRNQKAILTSSLYQSNPSSFKVLSDCMAEGIQGGHGGGRDSFLSLIPSFGCLPQSLQPI